MPEIVNAAGAFTREGFESFLADRSEPSWSLDRRRQAWDAFESLPWPSGGEEWSRTDIRGFRLEKFQLPTAAAQPSAFRSVLRGDVPFGAMLETGDSATQRREIRPELSDRGVLCLPLEEAVSSHEAICRDKLFSAISTDADRFAALHAACWAGGQFIYVPRNVCVEQPLHLLSGVRDGGVDLGHTLIVIEEGAEATILQESVSSEASATGLHCGAVEIHVGPRARLRYVNLQDWSRKTWHFARQRAVVDQDASLQWTIAALGARLAKVNQSVDLVGRGAECQVNGVMFTQGRQHLAYHTLQRHRAAACRSDFLYKAALQDQSRTVWRGMIQVDPEAQQTDGYQRNDNLLLSEQARSDSIPGLEIEADDVRCTHGATSGRVDDELIFYAQTRGYTRNEAVRMIVSGFFQQIFDRITIASVRDALGESIAERVRDVA